MGPHPCAEPVATRGAQWEARFGRGFTRADIDELYEVFTPMNAAVVPDFCDFIPGALDTVAAVRARAFASARPTGYNRPIMEVVTPIAAEGGYVPDNLVCAGDLAAGRPSPLMDVPLLRRPRRVARPFGGQGGRHRRGRAGGPECGTWAVGLAISGNAAGLTLAGWQALDAAGQAQVRARATAELKSAGAHYVIDSVAELIPVLGRHRGADGARRTAVGLNPCGGARREPGVVPLRPSASRPPGR